MWLIQKLRWHLRVHITKSILFWKLTFKNKKQIAEPKTKVRVNLANKYKVKANNFITMIFHIPVYFLQSIGICNALTIFFFISIPFFFQDLLKTSKDRITINEIQELMN